MSNWLKRHRLISIFLAGMLLATPSAVINHDSLINVVLAAQKKISELPALTGANTATDDDFLIIDTSVTTTKRINRTELIDAINTNFTTNANGPAILDEASSVTNPTLVPDKTDLDTGIGGDGANSLSFIVGGIEAIRIDPSPDVKIGTPTTAADGLLHLETGSAGAITAANEGDDLIVEHSGNVGMTFLSPNTTFASILFGDPQDNDAGRIVYDHTVPDLSLWVEGVEALTIDGTGGGRVTFANDVFVSKGAVIGHTAKVSVGGTAQFQILGTTSSDSAEIIGRWSNNDLPPKISFAKSRGASIGTSIIVNDDDVVGLIRFCPDDGESFTTLAAQFGAEVDDASPAVGDIGMAFTWEQMDGGGGALVETMRLSAAGTLVIAGNVEIGSEGGGTKRLAIKGSDPTGTGEGGEIQLFLADDFDTTITNYVIDAFQDDLRFFGAGGTPNITLTAEGYLVLTSSAKTTTGDPASREGMVYWNTVDNAIRMFADGAWRTLASW